MSIGFEHYWPKRRISPQTEIACLIIAGALTIPVMVGFGIVKFAEWLKGKIK